MKKSIPIHAILAVASFAVLLGLAHLCLGQGRGLPPKFYAGIVVFGERTTPLLPRLAVPPPESASTLLLNGLDGRTPLLADANGGLDRFYEALYALEQHRRAGAVRITHYGDSPTTADLITGDVRELLQKRWGDAGHGFVLIAKPWAWYNHRNVEVSGSGWKIDTAVSGHRDGEYGYGGAIFDGSAGASSHIRLTADGDTAVELAYMATPGGGQVELSSDGKPLKTISTSASVRQPGFAALTLPGPARSLDLRVTGGSVRLYGVTLSKPGAGVVYDSLGLNGATTVVLSRIFNQELLTAELQHGQPDLVVINYGTNESSFASFVESQYEGELKLAIQRVRKALPQASILVMSPMDRGERSGGEVRTMATIPEIVEIQRRVAAESGCGFFNTYEAMGGDSTMARWYEGQPRMVAADLIHPTPKGARLVAESFASQLESGYMRYKLRVMRQSAAEK
jgi:lysophospholipase L1-like esterase